MENLTFFGFCGGSVESFDLPMGASMEPVRQWMRETLTTEGWHEEAYAYDGASWLKCVTGPGGAEMVVSATDVPDEIRHAAALAGDWRE